MPSSSRIPVALLGLGGVGVAILKQLTSAPLASKFELQLIANSKRCLVASKSSSGGGPIDDVSSALDRLNQDGQSMQLDQVISLIGSGGIFVDSTASDDVAATYPSLLRRGVHVVTPNKKAASSSLSLWKDILDAQAQPGAGKYYGESTVGAGLPILSTLTDLVETGDEIHKVEGVFSGTLSYIFNEFAPVPSASAAHDGSEKSVPFSDVVKVAKEQGYTEPDPRDDLSGTDVARKLTILSRLCDPLLPLSTLPEGYASVPTRSLVPEALQACSSKEEYMQRLAEGDEEMTKLKVEAEREGKVVRFVGVVDVASGKVEARLEKYAFDHPFASSLKGSDNVVAFTTARYTQRPLLVQGAGAGADVTAMGVTADMLKLWRRVN